MPEVSFLLPVYNGARYLRETLDSIAAQDHQDFDILVVDDGSNDRTPEIVSEFAHPRLKYHRQENMGLVGALNAGLKLLDCTYVARIDADDLCTPDRLSKQLDFIDFTGAAAVSAKSLHIDEVGNVIALSSDHPVAEPDAHWLPAREPYLPHPFLFARRTALEEIGGYRQAHLSEDADLCWRLAERWRIALQGDVLGRYRVHAASISVASPAATRVQACYAQIAALNAVRRTSWRSEIPYNTTMEQALAAAERGWPDLLALHADHLNARESTWLAAASTLKLLDIAAWRKLRLGTEDVFVAERSLRSLRGIDPRNRAAAEERIAQAKSLLPQEKTARGFRRIFGGGAATSHPRQAGTQTGLSL